MHPTLIEIGNFFVPTYGVLLALAYLVSIGIAVPLAKKEGVASDKIIDLGLYVLVSALIGAKLFALALAPRYYIENPKEILSLIRVAGVYYGGFLCAAVVALWFARRHRLPVWRILDIAAVVLPVGQFIGRLGCLSAGCCYGSPSKWGFSVTFHNEVAHKYTGVPLNIPLYPSQIYLALAGLITFAVIFIIYRNRRYEAQTFGWFLIISSALRFLLEYFRGDPRGYFLASPLSTSQGISVIFIVVGVVILMYKSRSARAVGE